MRDINRISTGIAKTWVNGQVVYADGKATGTRPGRVVRRTNATARAPQTPDANASDEEH
jgi:N-acyl-D-aspartate/D-glutamate deacylase